MLNKLVYSSFIFLVFASMTFAQENKSKTTLETNLLVKQDSIEKNEIRVLDVLAPSKAAFYSAVLPGLGQVYNKKYWKVPIVYVAIGLPVYFFIKNDRELELYRNAFKRRLAGFNDDPFQGISNDGLVRAQQQLRRNKELSLLLALGAYALNIVDANVDAHLLQFNVDENLSLHPHFKYNEMENNTNLGVSLNFKF